MVFADEHEQKAHDVVCMVKFGSYGGSVDSKLVKRVGDILRGGPIKPKVKLPTPMVRVNIPPAVKVKLP